MNSAIQPESLPNPHLRLCSNEKSISVSPLFATHRSRSQIIENPLTLSPLLATHTDFSPVSPVFATHTKTAGVYTNNSHSGTRASSLPKNRRSFFSCTYKLPILHPLCFDIHASDAGCTSSLFFNCQLSATAWENPMPEMSRPKNFRVYFLLAALAFAGLTLILREHRPSFLRPGLRLYAYVTTADGSVTVVDLV